MELQLPTTLDNPRNLKLPDGNTLESLYQISDQSIWFLTWILKQKRFWPDLTRAVLEQPFTVERQYWSKGHICLIKTHKNYRRHGVHRNWYVNGQLFWEDYWKNGKPNGIRRRWYTNGQIQIEQYWKEGILDGIYRSWHDNGQPSWEQHWKNGYKIYEKYEKYE